MSFLFGGKAPPQESGTKAALRDVRGASRRMQREDQRAGTEEQALMARIRADAAGSRLDECKANAGQLVRLRAHRRAARGMRGHLDSLAQQLATAQNTAVMVETMARTAALLTALNAKMDSAGMHRALLQFERQQCALADRTEVLTETLDAAFEAQDEDADADAAVVQILQEMGLEVAALGSAQAPLRPPPGELDTDLEARLARLRA